MDTNKRLCGIENRRNYLSAKLKKEFRLMFARLTEVGYNHHDIYLFCQKWLEIYAAYKKANDKLLAMQNDLPF